MRTSRLVLRIPVPGRGIKPIRCSVRSIRQDLAACVDAHIASAAELTLEEVLLVENTVTCRSEADQHLSAEFGLECEPRGCDGYRYPIMNW
jgi:hypothetical protein